MRLIANGMITGSRTATELVRLSNRDVKPVIKASALSAIAKANCSIREPAKAINCGARLTTSGMTADIMLCITESICGTYFSTSATA